MPGVISNGTPRPASACAAATRCSSLNASRFASATARKSALDFVTDMQRVLPLSSQVMLSSSAKAGDPVFQSTIDSTARPRRTGYPACAGYDDHWIEPRDKFEGNQRNKSAKPQWPLERSIPEFPTK